MKKDFIVGVAIIVVTGITSFAFSDYVKGLYQYLLSTLDKKLIFNSFLFLLVPLLLLLAYVFCLKNQIITLRNKLKTKTEDKLIPMFGALWDENTSPYCPKCKTLLTQFGDHGCLNTSPSSYRDRFDAELHRLQRGGMPNQSKPEKSYLCSCGAKVFLQNDQGEILSPYEAKHLFNLSQEQKS